MWREAAIVYFTASFQKLCGGTKYNHEVPQEEELVRCPRFEESN
jgi:hypothetical protein